jgi:hypothetical protein
MVSLPKPVVAVNRRPTAIERSVPSAIWRPRSSDDRLAGVAVEDRIRKVFHLGAADRLPVVRQKSLRIYHSHLTRFLAFPFRASHCEETEPLVLDDSVIATGLCDPIRVPLDSARGILCEVVFGEITRLPLALLRAEPNDPNYQLIEDYWHWFWNCR